MNLTAQQVFDATLVVTRIINEGRPLSTRGAFLMARLHAKLLPEFNTISTRRDEMIKAYDHHAAVEVGAFGEDGYGVYPSSEFSVPAEKMPEFTADWGEIGREVLEVDVSPVPLGCLDGAPIAAAEFATLGDLVVE